ncbi:hypothetical protein Ahy_A07g032322 [Arachis hypogaea]|uniref:PB1-like domain-containing protein n=1 Tax=Arachis hypogaea TaxID=3818 RepID=A0A445C6N7_ARAHY|nr:hypothetical protein Ahy_A07g032322 [Arachis hypogaea]
MPYPCLISTIVVSFTPKCVVSHKMEGPPMTFVFHHGGLFRTGEDGDMVYEPDNTEVLMGVEKDTLDVFFVRGYYKELGYIEAGNCWWKVPRVLIPSGLKKLVTDVNLIAMCKDCRRNHHLINLYFEDCISQPCVVDNIGEGVALLEAGTSKKKKFSSQAKMHHSQPVKTPIAQSSAHQQNSTINKPKPTIKGRQPHIKTSSQPAKNPDSDNKKGNTSACRVTRSGRTVSEGPIQDEDSDSHDSYESTEDELHKPPKVLGDNLYSSESDSESGKGSQRKQKQAEAKEKHRPPKSRLVDKEIDTDNSSYEGFEDEESSESDAEEDDDDLGSLAATQTWTLSKLVPKLRRHPTMKHREVYDWFVRKCNRAYCFNVNPVKGQDLWEKMPHPAPVPPQVKPKPRRPTKK